MPAEPFQLDPDPYQRELTETTTVFKFRHVLERQGLGEQICEGVVESAAWGGTAYSGQAR